MFLFWFRVTLNATSNTQCSCSSFNQRKILSWNKASTASYVGLTRVRVLSIVVQGFGTVGFRVVWAVGALCVDLFQCSGRDFLGADGF